MTTLEESPHAISSIAQDYTKRLMVFGGRASMELAARIAGKLDVDLGQVDLRTFADGEVYCRYQESIRGADIFLVQSTAANASQGMTPNDALMEMLVMIDAAKGASAHRIIAVMPWYGYSRQDKKSAPREPISARVVAQCLEAVGVRPRPDHGPALRPGPGLLLQARRPHDRDADADSVLHGPGLGRRARDRLPGRRPREGGAQLRPQGRRPLGGDGEGAAGPAGRRDRLRGRRRARQDGRPRRRHDRHRRNPLRRRPHGARRGRRAGDRLRHPRRLLRPRLRAARLRGTPGSSASW